MACCIAMRASPRKALLASAGSGWSNIWRLAEARCAKRTIFLTACCPMPMIWVYSPRKRTPIAAISWEIFRRRLLTLALSARRLRWRKKNAANPIPLKRQARTPRLQDGRRAYELGKLAAVGLPGNHCAHHDQLRDAGAGLYAHEFSLHAWLHLHGRPRPRQVLRLRGAHGGRACILVVLRLDFPVARQGGMVAGNADRNLPWSFCARRHHGAVAGPASANGQRAARSGGAEPAGAAGIFGVALWRANTSRDSSVPCGVWGDPRRVLPAGVSRRCFSGRIGIGDRAQQGVLRLARIEPRVLRHDRNIRADDTGIIGVARDGLGIGEVVEPDVPRTARGHHDMIGAGRLAVFVIDG